jgi:toxin ParE1/3/4
MIIKWSPLAVDRASEIAEYIAKDDPTTAKRWVEALFARVEQLKIFPESGRIVPEINVPLLRELIYGNYRIIYRIEEKKVAILTIRHGKQILPVNEILT